MMCMRIVRLTFPSWHRRYAEKDALRDLGGRPFLSGTGGLARQRLSHLTAGGQSGVVRRLAAGDALAGQGDTGIAAVTLPVAHPLAVAPAEGAEQRHALAAEHVLAGVEHGLEVHLLQHLGAHGGADRASAW